jgi:hypothetical protein
MTQGPGNNPPEPNVGECDPGNSDQEGKFEDPMPPTLVLQPRAPDSSEPFEDPILEGGVEPSKAPEIPGHDDFYEETSEDPQEPTYGSGGEHIPSENDQPTELDISPSESVNPSREPSPQP